MNADMATIMAERAAEKPVHKLLPQGTNNYEISKVWVDTDQKGRKYLDLTFKSSDASGNHRVNLVSMSDSDGAVKYFNNNMASMVEVFGYDGDLTGVTPAQIAAYFAKAARSLVGTVVEVYVKHEPHWQDTGREVAKTYLNKVVRAANPVGVDDLLLADAPDPNEINLDDYPEDDSIPF